LTFKKPESGKGGNLKYCIFFFLIPQHTKLRVQFSIGFGNFYFQVWMGLEDELLQKLRFLLLAPDSFRAYAPSYPCGKTSATHYISCLLEFD
jgi:hypothetical protein